MEKKIKIGVIGCSAIAERSMVPAIQSLKSFELAAVASRSKDRANYFARKFPSKPVLGYLSLLKRDDIEAVYISLPIGMHHEWAMHALDHGKHVLVEKSLAMTYSSALEIGKKAEEKGLFLMESFMFKHHSQHRFVRGLLDKGELGDVRCFRSSFGFPPLKKDNIRYIKELGGGALLDAGAYTVMATQMFLGTDLEVIGAHLEYDENLGIELYGGALIKNAKGQLSEIAFGFDNFYQCNYEIWGSKGRVIVEKAFTPMPDYSPIIILEKQGIKKEFTLNSDNHFIKILEEFLNCIKKQEHEKYRVEALNQAKLMELIRKSSKR